MEGSELIPNTGVSDTYITHKLQWQLTIQNGLRPPALTKFVLKSFAPGNPFGCAQSPTEEPVLDEGSQCVAEPVLQEGFPTEGSGVGVPSLSATAVE